MSDLSIRAIKGIYEVKSSTNEQIKRCKTYEKKIIRRLSRYINSWISCFINNNRL